MQDSRPALTTILPAHTPHDASGTPVLRSSNAGMRYVINPVLEEDEGSNPTTTATEVLPGTEVPKQCVCPACKCFLVRPVAAPCAHVCCGAVAG